MIVTAMIIVGAMVVAILTAIPCGDLERLKQARQRVPQGGGEDSGVLDMFLSDTRALFADAKKDWQESVREEAKRK